MRKEGWIQKLEQWYKNLKFRKKVLLVQIAVSMIPVIILGIFAYVQTRNLLIDREKESMKDILHQNVITLDYTLSLYQNYMVNMVWDESLQRAVNDPYENSYQMYLMYTDVMDPMIQNIEAQNLTIQRITIYGNNETLYPHGTNYLPLAELPIDADQLKTSQVYWVSDGKKNLELYCKMYSGNPQNVNVIYMKVNYEKIFDYLRSLFESKYKICLSDEDGNVIFSFYNWQESMESRTDAKTVKEEDVLSVPGWNVELYRPVTEITASARSITFLVTIVIALCIILIACFSVLLSKSVTKPLGELIQNIQRIGQGRLETDINEESTDEIGQLIKNENIFQYEILNLILQPLAENAIVHGLDHKEDEEPKKLTVTGEEKEDFLLFRVCDNGCGMPEEIRETILTIKTSGYGVQNVHQRIVLYYGEEYGLHYESTEGKGTVIEVKIPKVMENQQK